MRRFLLYLLTLLAPVFPALAATTWSPSDKDAGITLSGSNLIATSSATNAFKTVRATTAKDSGKFCYQFTVNHSLSNLSIGFANAEYPLSQQAVLGVNDFITSQYYAADAIGLATNGNIYWYYASQASGDPPVNTKTGEACLNLDLEAPRFWITPDITGTSGAGGGPKWNNSGTDTPVGNVGGIKVYLPWVNQNITTCCYFPTFTGYNNDQVTGIFTGFTPPTGYSTWDTAGSDGTETPGPLNPLVINVANAPEWQQSHAYSVGDRVLAGPALTIPSTYTNGANLYLWAVDAGGGGTSSGSGNGPQTCGSPANTGGIPTRTWGGATRVTDGSVSWVCLTKVDYISLFSAWWDDAAWTPTTGYGFQQIVVNSVGDIFNNTTALSGTSCGGDACNPSCTSGSGSGPTQGSPNEGTCTWTYRGHLPYTSGIHWPHMTPISGTPWYYRPYGHKYDTTVNVWYGGYQRPRYQDGAFNEPVTEQLRLHTFDTTDLGTYCKGYGDLGPGPILEGYARNQFSPACTGLGKAFRITLQPPPGDRWNDNVSPTVGPLGKYDETKGVSFYSNTTVSTCCDTWGQSGTMPFILEASLDFKYFQSKSEHGAALFGNSFGGSASYNLLESMEGPYVVWGASIDPISNNIIISHSTTPGCTGIFSKFGATPIINNTIIGAGTSNCTAIAFYEADGLGMFDYTHTAVHAPYRNNLIFGFPNTYAYGSLTGALGGTALGMMTDVGGNATDVSSSPPLTPYNMPSSHLYGTLAMTPVQLLGIDSTCGAGNSSPCTSLSAANQFVSPTLDSSIDLRLKSNADVLGAGTNFSTATAPHFTGTMVPGSDILGTTRPQ